MTNPVVNDGRTYTGPKTKNLMERIPSDEAGQGEYVDEDVGDQNDDNRMYEEIGEA